MRAKVREVLGQQRTRSSRVALRAGGTQRASKGPRMRRYDPVEAFSDADADSICHCGRLKRFSRCCQPHPAEERLHRMAVLSLHERSLATVGAVKYFFGC